VERLTNAQQHSLPLTYADVQPVTLTSGRLILHTFTSLLRGDLDALIDESSYLYVPHRICMSEIITCKQRFALISEDS
jgi:hypothetical protein